MSQATFSDSSNISSEVIALAEQLKTLYDVELHKKKFKSTTLKTLKAIISRHLENQDTFFITTASKKKTRTVKAKFSKLEKELFSFDWVIYLFLITTAIKILLKEIEDFRNRLISSRKILITIEIEQFLVSFVFIERQTTSSTKVLSVNRFISKEDSFFVLLDIIQESSFLFRDTEEEIIFESRLENSKFSELSASSKKSKSSKFSELSASSKKSEFSFNSKNSEHILHETKNISRRASFHHQKKKLDKSKKLQILSSQISLENYSFTHQTSSRVQSIRQISRVQSDVHLFQFSHLTNLKELFITRFFIVSTISSSETLIRSNTNTALSEEYFSNAFSIVFRQYNIQSLQELIQRNFDFLESILSKVINSQFDSAESFSNITSQNLSNSISSSLESNRKESSQNNITIQKKSVSFISFTTSFSKNQINSFLSFSTLSFDSFFQQFRSSFFSNSFISFVKSIFSSRLSAKLNRDLNSSRIQKLNDCTVEKISQEIFTNFVSVNIYSTKITSVMSTFEENVSLSSVSNLTQQDIQEIVLFKFNLFAQNVQSQTQAKTVEATIDVVATTKKDSFRTSDVKFFDFQLNSSYESDDVVQIKRNLYYRDVYLFVKRIKNVVIMSETNAVRINLSACLRDSTQVWYTEDLSDLKKKALRTLENDANHWCNALLKKFKKFVAFALNYLIIERYTLNDVRANRNISSFVFQIMRHAKVANIANLHDQLTWAYNVIASELIKDIDSFDENTSIMTFLKNLKTKKDIWHRIYSRKFNSSRTESEFSQYQINFSNSFFSEYEQTTYTQKQYRSSFENVSEQRNYQRFQANDNVFLKDKVSVRVQKIFDEYNQQTRFSNITFDFRFSNITIDQTQFSDFETQQVRNQAISAWDQNASQENTIN